ncbi:DUF4252 domain-containing protein [Sungkyunkwania multivorans]|uniref:DUF4252 domain-containing protein n=1 Tax=Sungkyunkwania multivorans TaxID=1173618 RepID=A0ABW3CYI3_9FLAO
MNTLVKIVVSTLIILVLGSCSSEQSLQQYYVQGTEDPNFLVVDIPASMLNLSESELSTDQKEAYQSLGKLNILAYRLDPAKRSQYEAEKIKVNEILKNEKYEELMRFSSGEARGVVKFIGDDESIDELILFGSYKDMGFAVVRVLGDEMKPENMMQLVKAVESSQINTDGFGQLKDFFESK